MKVQITHEIHTIMKTDWYSKYNVNDKININNIILSAPKETFPQSASEGHSKVPERTF
jgi:hypothetical protein